MQDNTTVLNNPDNSNKIIGVTISRYLHGDKSSIYDVIDHVKLLLNEQKKYVDDSDIAQHDTRTGYESYGYGNIMNTMDYISDRFRCEFRLQWLLTGIENREF